MRDVLRPGDMAVDVGAHKGAYTWWMQRSVGRSGRVVAFEPQPFLAAQLHSLFRGDKVETVHAAVSSASGTMQLWMPPGESSPGARLDQPMTMPGARSIDVPVTTLDSHLDDSKPVAFIKIDVEGHESAVLEGARGVLSRQRPSLLMECETRHRGGPVSEVVDYLAEFGYEATYFCADGRLPFSEFDPAAHQDDRRSPGYVNNFAFVATD